MKKLRVFQTVKSTDVTPGGSSLSSNKRIVPGFFTRSPGTVLLFLLLLPYLVTFLFGNLREGAGERTLLEELDTDPARTFYVMNETALGTERIPLELYVADRLARSMDHDYEMEALKAQAVLIRSGLLSSAAEGEYGTDIRNRRSIKVEDADYGSVQGTRAVYEAVAKTKGVYLVYDGQPIKGSYFAVSNGATRSGEEIRLFEYPYLKSVSCSRDFLSPDYASSAFYEEKEFEKIFEQIMPFQITEEEKTENEKTAPEEGMDGMYLYRDSAGYVRCLEWKGKYVSGEQFREAYFLSSSSFHIAKEETKVFITVEGAGHGLGMSQFAANEMAKDGDDYIKILDYFFQDVELKKL